MIGISGTKRKKGDSTSPLRMVYEANRVMDNPERLLELLKLEPELTYEQPRDPDLKFPPSVDVESRVCLSRWRNYTKTIFKAAATPRQVWVLHQPLSPTRCFVHVALYQIVNLIVLCLLLFR